MPNCIWQGDVSTDPTVNGNWSTGAVPAAGDDVIFDGTAQADCVGGPLAGVQIISLTITADCTINIGASAADALDLDCAGPVNDWGSGVRYLNVQNSTSWNVGGSGTCYVDGIDNDGLTINSTGTVVVGPIITVPAEFNTTIVVINGTVTFHYVTDQAAAATNVMVLGGTVYCYDDWDVVQVFGGNVYQHDGSGLSVYVYGGILYWNSTDKCGDTILEVYTEGEATFKHNAGGCTVDACKIYGGTVDDPNGMVTWTTAVEVHGLDSSATINWGPQKKHTIAAIV